MIRKENKKDAALLGSAYTPQWRSPEQQKRQKEKADALKAAQQKKAADQAAAQTGTTSKPAQTAAKPQTEKPQFNAYQPFGVEYLDNMYYRTVQRLNNTNPKNRDGLDPLVDAYEAVREYGLNVQKSYAVNQNNKAGKDPLMIAQPLFEKRVQQLEADYQTNGLSFAGMQSVLAATGYKSPAQIAAENAQRVEAAGGAEALAQQNPWIAWAADNAGKAKEKSAIYARLPGLTQQVKQRGYPSLTEAEQEVWDEFANSDFMTNEMAERMTFGELTEEDLAQITQYGQEQAGLIGDAASIYQTAQEPTLIQARMLENMRSTLEGAKAWAAEEPDSEDAKRNLYFLEQRDKYAAYDTNGAYDPSVTDKIYLYVNDVGDEREKQDAILLRADGGGVSFNPNSALRYMTEEEKGRYNAIFASEGVVAADAYLTDYLMYTLNQRQKEAQEQAAYDEAQSGAWGAIKQSALSVPLALLSGAGALELTLAKAGNQSRMGSYRPLDYAGVTQMPGAVADASRQGVMDSVDWNVNLLGEDTDAFDFLYGTGMRGLDSLAAGAVSLALGPGSVAALLGSAGAQRSMVDIHERGGDDTQAVVGGLMAGLFEGLFEKVSLGKFYDSAKTLGKGGVKAALKDVAAQAGINASEEFFTELANITFDAANMGDKSNVSAAYQEYIDLGMTEGEARAKVAGNLAFQALEAGAGGLLQGAGMGAVSNAISGVKTGKANREAGSAFLTTYTRENLKTLGESLGADTEAGKLAARYDIKKAGMGQSGQLYRAIVKQLPQQMRGTLQETVARDIAPRLTQLDDPRAALGIAQMLGGEQPDAESYQALAHSRTGMALLKETMNAVAQQMEAEKTAGQETQSPAGEAGNRFSIKQFPDGKQYVEVDTDQHLFDGADESEYRKIAKEYIRSHFMGSDYGASQDIRVTGRSAKEFAYPANRRLKSEVRNGKLRASTELDNLLAVSEYVGHEDDDGRHAEATGGWDIYNVVYKVGDRFFEGRTKVMRAEGQALFYDITQIKDITRRSRSFTQDAISREQSNASEETDAAGFPSVYALPHPRTSTTDLPENIIPESTGNSKQKNQAAQRLQVDADGDVTTENADGQRVSVSDLGLNPAEETLLQDTAQLGDTGSGAAMEAWKKEPQEEGATPEQQRTSAESFARGFAHIFRAAKAGKTPGETHTIYGNLLSREAWEKAWKAGEAARREGLQRIVEQNARRAAADGFQTVEKAGEQAGVSYAQVTKNITEWQKTRLQLIDSFAKEYGLRVHVQDTLSEGRANGQLRKGTNVINLALDAEEDSLTRTVSHEAYHFVAEWSPEKAKKLQQFVTDALNTKKGYDLKKRVQEVMDLYQQNGQQLTEGEALEEITADSVLDVIGTEGNLKKLMQQDRTLAQKMGDALKDMVEKLRALVERLAGNSPEVKALMDDVDAVSAISQQMEGALQTAKEAYQQAQFKASELARQDSSVQEYQADMASATAQADKQTALNGLVSGLFVRAERGWLAEHMDADLDASLAKFAEALKSYMRGEAALSIALQRAGFDAQPYEMNTALSYAGNQLLEAERRGGEGDVKYQLKKFVKNGREFSYVKADRQVIQGDDPKSWAAQITDYINKEIRHGKDVTVYTENGVPLTITKDTAGKAAFWNANRSGDPVPKEEYGLKLRIEAHIDEAARVSVGKGQKATDTKTHSFAREGWNYRRAYFEDFDGRYYSFQISVGKNGKVNTIYNVNEIKEEADTPNTLKGAQPQNATVGADASSDSSIPKNPESVNTKFSLKKGDIAQSVADDAALYAQVTEDEELRTAAGLYYRLHYLAGQEGFAKGQWEGRLPEIAAGMIQETGSTYGKIRLYRDLRTLYGAMDSQEAAPGELMVYAREIGKKLLEAAPGVAKEQDETTKEALRRIKQSPFYWTDDQKSEIREVFGSVQTYNRKNFGKIGVRAKAGNGNAGAHQTFAEVWVNELSPLMPGTFPADAAEADMPVILNAFLENAGDRQFSGAYGANAEQYATDIGLNTILSYFDVPGALRKAQAIREEYRKNLKKLRKEYRGKFEKRMKISSERKALTEEKNGLRGEISRAVRSMNGKLLADTDARHVPQGLKGAVSAMVKPFLEETGVFSGPELRRLLEEYGLLREDGKNGDVAAAYAYDPDIQEKIERVARTMEGRRLSQLTLEELQDLRDIVGNLNRMVAEQNEIQLQGRRETLDAVGQRAIREQKEKATLSPAAEKALNLWYSNSTPIYFFKRLGGVFSGLWDEVREGQTRYIFHLKKAKAYMAQQMEKYRVNDWYHRKDTLQMDTEEGGKIELTMGQAMYLYATWQREMKNRQQGAAHLRVGGFVYRKRGENGKTEIDTAHPHALTYGDMQGISDYLGQEAREFVNEAVRYLSQDMAALGNETSMERYGYEKFGESYYFPYKVSGDYTETNLARSQEETPGSLFAWGASKKTVKAANKPVVLGDFLEAWADHVNEMCVYNGFATAVDNLNRVYNYVEPGAKRVDAEGNILLKNRPESLRAEIARAHGSGAAKYLANITRAIAGGQIGRSEDLKIQQKLISRFRKNAVVLSASVAVQQPSAIARAMTQVNPKFFVGKPVNPRAAYQEMMQYSGTANVKAMGKFDIGMGQSARQWVLDDLKSGSRVKDIYGKAEEMAGKGPELMDSLTWANLWEVVKREQTAINPLLNPESEAFLQLCGKRFDEVVDLTQVYDSVLDKSQLMRSSDGMAQMVTSFMGEPTKTTNMLMDAILNYREDKSTRRHVTVKRAAAVYVASVFLNALLKSLVTAARDDDEEKSYVEKYVAQFVGNFTDDLNPLGNIPFVQDIVSIFSGYDVERTDMALISDLYDAWTVIMSEDRSAGEKVTAAGKSVGALFGVPVKNILREVQTGFNLARSKPIGETSATNIKYGVLEALPFGWDRKATAYYGRMKDALQRGDTAQYEELKNYVTGTMGKEEKTVNTGVKSALRDAMLDGEVSRQQAQTLLQQHFDTDENDAYFLVDRWLAEEENGDSEDFTYSKYSDFYRAVETGANLKAAIRELTGHGVAEKDMAARITAQYKDQYVELYKTNRTAAANLKARLLTAYAALGYDRNKKNRDIDAWLKEK